VENKTAADATITGLQLDPKKENRKKWKKRHRERELACVYVQFSVEKKYYCGCLITRLQQDPKRKSKNSSSSSTFLPGSTPHQRMIIVIISSSRVFRWFSLRINPGNS
jgi:hypothetical protein